MSEKTKHVEDLGHDVRHGYKYIYIKIYIYKYIYRKIIAAVRLGGLAPARPIIGASVSEPPLVDSTDALSR